MKSLVLGTESMMSKAARIKVFIVILCLIIVPSAIRTFGFFSGEIWRFQQSLGGDKVLHLIVGVSLMAAFVVISKAFSSIQKLTAMFIFACSVLAIEELFQFLTPGRHFEWVDMLLGILGSSIVFVAGLIYVFYQRERVKIKN